MINLLITVDEYRSFSLAHSDEVMKLMADAEQLGRKRLNAFLASAGDAMMCHMVAFVNGLTELPRIAALMPELKNVPKLTIPEPVDILTIFIAIAYNELLMPVILENSKPAEAKLN